MNDTSTFGLPEAARRLGVSVRVLRGAMRAGTIPAPAQLTATATLSAAWFDSVVAALEASPGALSWHAPQKVAPFARYEGTSCWRKYRNRVRAYYAYREAQAA